MTPGQRELTRLAYLQAMDIAGYVARSPLPGAAPSHPLASLVLKAPASTPTGDNAKAALASALGTESAALPAMDPARHAALTAKSRLGAEAEAPVGGQQTAPSAVPVPTFTVVATLVADVLWLEELRYPALATEQVQLLQAMAAALGIPNSRFEVTQFNWPLHRNRQLDQGEEAAIAALTGFASRQLEEQSCRAVVLLGASVRQRVSASQLSAAVQISTVSTAEMLEQPTLKAQAWRDLRPLVQR